LLLAAVIQYVQANPCVFSHIHRHELVELVTTELYKLLLTTF
jgi:hypothetical protein